MTNQVATQEQRTVGQLISAQMPAIAKALSGNSKEDRERRTEQFARVALTQIKNSPQLMRCTQDSLAAALMECASFDIYPDPRGQAYLVPYKAKVNNKWVEQAQFMLGYKGMIELAYRSGEVKSIRSEVVYENEVKAGTFHYQGGLDESIKHDLTAPLLDMSLRTGEIVAAYAVAQMKDGTQMSRLIDRNHIDKRKAASKSASGNGAEYSPWNKWEDEMIKKTAIKALCKTLPQSIERLHIAVAEDDLRDAGKAVTEDSRLMIEADEMEFSNVDDVNAAIEQADAETKATE